MAAADISPDVLDAVIAAIEGINGAPGGYTFDLSDGNRTTEDRIDSPPRLPFVAVVLDDIRSTNGPAIGDYNRTMKVRIVGWPPVTGDSTRARRNAALYMLGDISRAIEADRSLGALVLDVTLDGTAVIAADGAEHSAAALIVLETHWYADTGV